MRPMLCAFHPGLLPTLGLWALAGLCSAYQVQLIAEYITAVPDHGRGQAMGLASAGLLAVQGIGLLAGGALAQVWAVVPTIAATGAAGRCSSPPASPSTGRAATTRQTCSRPPPHNTHPLRPPSCACAAHLLVPLVVVLPWCRLDLPVAHVLLTSSSLTVDGELPTAKRSSLA